MFFSVEGPKTPAGLHSLPPVCYRMDFLRQLLAFATYLVRGPVVQHPTNGAALHQRTYEICLKTSNPDHFRRNLERTLPHLSTELLKEKKTSLQHLQLHQDTNRPWASALSTLKLLMNNVSSYATRKAVSTMIKTWPNIRMTSVGIRWYGGTLNNENYQPANPADLDAVLTGNLKTRRTVAVLPANKVGILPTNMTSLTAFQWTLADQADYEVCLLHPEVSTRTPSSRASTPMSPATRPTSARETSENTSGTSASQASSPTMQDVRMADVDEPVDLTPTSRSHIPKTTRPEPSEPSPNYSASTVHNPMPSFLPSSLFATLSAGWHILPASEFMRSVL